MTRKRASKRQRGACDPLELARVVAWLAAVFLLASGGFSVVDAEVLGRLLLG